jgi:hypothetical protein
MGKVIHLDERRKDWVEIFSTDGPSSMLQVYVNKRTGEAEVVQMNDDNEAIRTPLCYDDALMLSTSIFDIVDKVNKGTAI